MKRDRILVPTVRLFFSSKTGAALGSDALEPSQSQFPYGQDAENDDDPDEIEEDEGDVLVSQLRAELRETRNTVREQRSELALLRQDAAALEQQVEDRNEEILELRAELSEVVTPEGAAALQAEVEKLRKRVAKRDRRIAQLEAEKEKTVEEAKQKVESAAGIAKLEYDSLENDYHEYSIKSREEIGRLRRELETTGEGGKKLISSLEARVDEQRSLVLKAMARADRAEDEKLAILKEKEQAVGEARDKIVNLQNQLEREHREVGRLRGANTTFERRYKKAQRQLNSLANRRGTVVEASDDEQSDRDSAPPPAQVGPSSSRTFARTASSRSDALPFDDADLDSLLGLSPSKAKAGPRVNNNSTLLGGSPRKMKRMRSVMDEAYEVSGEVEMEDLPPAVKQEVEEEDEDDDREPDTETDGEGSSDLEIVEPAASAPSASRSRPFGSRPDLANRASSSSTSSSFFSSSAPAPFHTLTASSSSSLASTSKPAFASSGGFGSKPKPALSQSRADKYIPGFLIGGSQGGKGGQGTLELGQKKRPKVGRK
ncbi:hypothetical protein JCM8097_007919 [Rhodosporidiobolus ruineniae]